MENGHFCVFILLQFFSCRFGESLLLYSFTRGLPFTSTIFFLAPEQDRWCDGDIKLMRWMVLTSEAGAEELLTDENSVTDVFWNSFDAVVESTCLGEHRMRMSDSITGVMAECTAFGWYVITIWTWNIGTGQIDSFAWHGLCTLCMQSQGNYGTIGTYWLLLWLKLMHF